MLSSSLVPIRASKEYRPAKYLVENHQHPYFHMMYVSSGVLLVFCNDVSVRVEAGSIILLPPYAMHMIYSVDNTHSIEFKFSCERDLESLNATFMTRDYWLWDTEKKGQNCMSAIMREAENKDPQYLEIISCRIYEVLMQMLRKLERPMKEDARELDQAAGNISIDQLDQLSHDAIVYIDTHITDKLTVSDLAKQLGYNSAYFSTAFKKSTGIPPQQFITLRKINFAKNMIRKDQMSISAISDLLHFSNVAAFTNTFKKHSGMTPGQYAQNVRDCAYINLTESHDLPADNIRSIEPIHKDGIFTIPISTIP